MRFSMSFTVIRPRSIMRSSTTGSFSIRCLARMACAVSSVVPTGAVISSLRVMTSVTRSVWSSSKRRSRLVRMPTSLPSSVMGTPEMWKRAMIACASASVALGGSVTGSTIMPLSLRFTRSTCAACSAMLMFLWITPMPPRRASPMAMPDSVTVSIAALTMGMFTGMPRVKRERVSTSRGWMPA